MEEWRDIEEFEGIYQISNKGRCFSQKSNKMLKPHKYPNGYLFYSFKIKGKQFTRLISRLVAKAWIPNQENKQQVDHINGDKTDNRVENLRWVTQSENMLNPITNEKLRNGLKNSEKSKMALRKATDAAANKNRKRVYMYSLNGELEKIYNSVTDAANECGCFAQNISACCNGKKKQIKGHKWYYNPL